MPAQIQAVKGMNDILPPESALWEWFEAHVRDAMAASAYKLIRTPVVEQTSLYVKGTGETTDIVEKEMYSFEDKLNGDQLTLRPEFTPGIVRAAIEHNITYEGGKRLYSIGPVFRHERPQRGRYRQFYQLDVEALGFGGPEVDAETMLLAHDVLRRLGLSDVRVEINSLGVLSERQAHRAALIAYFESHGDLLDADAKRRLHANPLRILDTKNPAMQEMVAAAPKLTAYLGEASLKRLEAVQAMLAACGLASQLNHRLVRGLDYYNHTVFEFITDSLGAQGTVLGGGRYDGLFELVGGKPTPGVGWGMGVERVLDLVQTQKIWQPASELDAYAIVPDAQALPLVASLLQTLRAAGVRVQQHSSADGTTSGMKAQFKKADGSGAAWALIFGNEELANGQLAVKPLRGQGGEQRLLAVAEAANWAASLKALV